MGGCATAGPLVRSPSLCSSSSPPTLHQREMAALARPLLAALLLLGAVLAAQGRRHSRYLLTSNSQRELLKEAGNEIDHGPGYASQHKQHQWQKTGHKGHAWANKFKGGLKKRRFGHPGERLPANTAFDHDNINLQRLDSLPVTKKKGNPKSLTQMKKKSLQKPSKKMDKMYKKMLEKQRLQKKREKYEKLHKKTKKQVP